jgi:hypothetical protein
MFPSNLGKRTNFPNMAGRKDCDEFIARELEEAGIYLKKEDHKGEVPYHIVGELKGFKFHRAWYYWVVHGSVPAHVAWKMYENPIGRRDVRVDGYAGNTEPDINRLQPTNNYHIDSQEGLNYFVKTLKEEGMV